MAGHDAPRILLAIALATLAGCAPVDEHSIETPEVALAALPLSSIECSERADRGYRSGTPFDISVVTVDGRPVEVDTANAYYVMASAASRDGVEIRVVSGFRTMAEQEHLYYCYTSCTCNGCNLAARPGYSNHQSGHALDLNTSSTGVLAWLNAHAADYGFSRTVPSEAWHWEWWGGGPGGGPCGGCAAHCEGSVIVGRDCGRGDCGAYGSRCVDDALGVRCAFAFCPDRGTDTICLDENTIGTCTDGALATGDCSAYGSRCVDDALGARCAFFACPDRGESTVCLDEHIIGTCRDGAISTGDCSAYAAYCSTAGSGAARCVSAFCVASATDVPVEHDTCLLDGQITHCNADGIPVDTRPCPAGSPCTLTEGGARCGAEPMPDEPDPSVDAGASPDASRVDGGARDAGVGGADAGRDRAPAGSLTASCSCRAAGPASARSATAGLFAGCFLALLLARTRR